MWGKGERVIRTLAGLKKEKGKLKGVEAKKSMKYIKRIIG